MKKKFEFDNGFWKNPEAYKASQITGLSRLALDILYMTGGDIKEAVIEALVIFEMYRRQCGDTYPYFKSDVNPTGDNNVSMAMENIIKNKVIDYNDKIGFFWKTEEKFLQAIEETGLVFENMGKANYLDPENEGLAKTIALVMSGIINDIQEGDFPEEIDDMINHVGAHIKAVLAITIH